MLKLPGCKGTIKEIKNKVMDALKPEDKQSKQWETTFAKIFSRHKNLFIKTSAIFHLNKEGAK